MKPEIRIDEVSGRTALNITIGNNGQVVVVFEDAFTTLASRRNDDCDAYVESEELCAEDFGWDELIESGIMTKDEAEQAIAEREARWAARMEANERYQYERLKAKFEPEKLTTP